MRVTKWTYLWAPEVGLIGEPVSCPETFALAGERSSRLQSSSSFNIINCCHISPIWVKQQLHKTLGEVASVTLAVMYKLVFDACECVLSGELKRSLRRLAECFHWGYSILINPFTESGIVIFVFVCFFKGIGERWLMLHVCAVNEWVKNLASRSILLKRDCCRLQSVTYTNSGCNLKLLNTFTLHSWKTLGSLFMLLQQFGNNS